jgi:hypothetical protein
MIARFWIYERLSTGGISIERPNPPTKPPTSALRRKVLNAEEAVRTVHALMDGKILAKLTEPVRDAVPRRAAPLNTERFTAPCGSSCLGSSASPLFRRSAPVFSSTRS